MVASAAGKGGATVRGEESSCHVFLYPCQIRTYKQFEASLETQEFVELDKEPDLIREHLKLDHVFLAAMCVREQMEKA